MSSRCHLSEVIRRVEFVKEFMRLAMLIQIVFLMLITVLVDQFKKWVHKSCSGCVNC